MKTLLILLNSCLLSFSINAQDFSEPQLNPFSLVPLHNWGINSPAIADLDNDGDFDVLCGDEYGDFYFLRNDGTSNSPEFANPQLNPFSLEALNSWGINSPAIADLDADGDFDVLCGDEYGDFYYLKNIGSENSPAFAAPQQNPFSLEALNNWGINSPAIADLDDDGDFDVLCGDEYGDFYFLRNDGTSNSPTFAAPQLNPFSLEAINGWGINSPAIADLDNDGDFDVLSGDEYGDFYYLRNEDVIFNSIQEEDSSILDSVYPNPNNGKFTFTLNSQNEITSISVFNNNGSQISSEEYHFITIGKQINFEIANKLSGIYFIQVVSKNETNYSKIIIM